MPQLVLSNRFKKSLRNFIKKHPELRSVIQEKLKILETNPKDRRLQTQKLTGTLKGLLAASLTHEYRLILYCEKDLIFLITIGTHDEVY